MPFSKQHHRLPSATVALERAQIPEPKVPDEVVKDLNESHRLRREQRLDEELAQSFPASDPPSWVLGITPTPR